MSTNASDIEDLASSCFPCRWFSWGALSRRTRHRASNSNEPQQESTSTSKMEPNDSSGKKLTLSSHDVSPFSPLASQKIDILLDMPRVHPIVQNHYGWNEEDKSAGVDLIDGSASVTRRDFDSFTHGIRGKVGFSSGVHCWEITWMYSQRQIYPMVGVCTKDAPLTCPGYHRLLGMNDQSWGWDIFTSLLCHGGQIVNNERGYPDYPKIPVILAPDKFFVILDMDEGALSFASETIYMGVAFRGLKGKTLYPAISCVWNVREVGIKYINSLGAGPPRLSELCRRNTRRSLRKRHSADVTSLPLPRLLQEYILYK